MVGGIVIEVSEIKDRPGVLYVDCRDSSYRQTCAVLVEDNETSRKIEIGDSVWWQSGMVMWTPSPNRLKKGGKCGVDYDVRIPKIGYSGVRHPGRVEA